MLLKVSDPEAKLDALGRVRAWMEILTSSAIRGPSIKPPIRTVADAVARVLAQDPVLADSEWVPRRAARRAPEHPGLG